jgi:uncharacterized protein YbbK (DUF523 family)
VTGDADDLRARFARLHGPDAADAEQAARELAGAEVVVVSACLLGERVRYDGGDKRDASVEARTREPRLRVLPLCPELLAGMGCPRPAIWFTEGDGDALLAGAGAARDERGNDAGPALVRGAERGAELARLAGARRAILKERSPSCGARTVHCGDAGDAVTAGRGCFAARLCQGGITVENEAGERTR